MAFDLESEILFNFSFKCAKMNDSQYSNFVFEVEIYTVRNLGPKKEYFTFWMLRQNWKFQNFLPTEFAPA